MDTIGKCVCPRCGKLNFVELGDFEDFTVPDVDGYKCWNCKEVSRVNEKIICKDADGEYVDEDGCDVWIEDGKKQL
jgi:hypothetical protein